MKTGKRKNTTGSVLANLAGRSLLAAAAFALVGAGTVDAQLSFDADDTSQFGSWSLIDQAGNDHDPARDYGAVGYDYHIARHAASIADWDAFYGDGGSGVDGIGGGTAVGDFNAGYNYWNDGDRNVGTAAPVVRVSVFQAAQYANWLTTGDATEGAYTIDGTSGNVTAIDRTYRNAEGMLYALPTEDEWYKAAYFRLDDSTYYLDATPDGVTLTAGDDGDDKWNYSSTIGATAREVGRYGLEQNDTRNMMGNVHEWMEDTGGVRRGGSYASGAHQGLRASERTTSNAATYENAAITFRVVAIPEPASGALFVLASGLLWFMRRRARA